MSTHTTKQHSLWKRFQRGSALFLLSVMIFLSGLDLAQGQQESVLQDDSTLAQVISEKKKSDKNLMSINFTNVTLEKALEILADRINVGFSYNPDVMPNKTVSFEMRSVQAHEIIYKLLEGTNLEPVLPPSKDVIILREKEVRLAPEVLQETVTGNVTDAQSGEPLPGVNVIVMDSQEVTGSIIGTTTNMDGTYQIEVPEGLNTLVFSYIGFLREEIEIDGRNSIDVEMRPDITGLEELVVVGYGEQRRVNLTGSISSVNFDDAMESRPITNASQALGGKATGVWVSQNSGKPGDDGAQLRVRGWGTLNNANPLVIIDGVEGNLNQINPSDIESISVLKDAASAAIYGSKAANGVVLVTTKKGGYDERMSIKLSTYTGVQSLGSRYNLVNNSAEAMEMANTASRNTGGADRFPDYLITEFRNGNDPYKYPNTDWYEHLYRNAMIQEHNISVSGGSEQTSVYFSLNYLDQEGMILKTNSDRVGLRANVESTVNDRITIGGRMNYVNQNIEEPFFPFTDGGGPLDRVYNIFRTSAPFIAPYTRDGRLGAVQAIDREGTLLWENNNPLIDANNGRTSTDRNSINVNAYANINLTNNLNWRTTVASTGLWSTSDRFNEPVFGYTDTGVAATSRNLNREGIEVMRGNNQRMDRQVYSTLNFTENFNQHEVSTVTGIQVEDLSIKNLFGRRSDPPKTGLTQVDSGTGGVVADGNLDRLRIFSYFGRLNYSYANKYLFEANFRADASSRFSEDDRWGYFPGFSVGWRIIQEEFAQNWGLFSDLKIRGSWGRLGNQNIAGFWPYLPVINQNNELSYSYGGSFNPGGAITQLVDPNITWETTTSFDIGIEAGFFENKLKIQADYFDKVTEDILVRLPIPNTLGSISPPVENIGEMTNKGLELSVAYNNWAADQDEFGYSIELNLTSLNNEVTKFRGGDSPDQLFLLREGFSYQTLYGYNVEGIYQTNQEAAEHMNSNGFTPIAGDLRYEDKNGDGQLGFEDRQELGNTIPKFTFGINPNISYKGFDLNAVIQGVAKVHLWNQNVLTTTNGDGPYTISTMWRDSWTPQNTGTDIPTMRIDYAWNNEQSSFWVNEVSFVKLKNIQLGYSIPSNLTSKLGIQQIYVYTNAQNVGTWVFGDYDGYDPEKSTFDDGDAFYPVPRIFSFGVNIEL